MKRGMILKYAAAVICIAAAVFFICTALFKPSEAEDSADPQTGSSAPQESAADESSTPSGYAETAEQFVERYYTIDTSESGYFDSMEHYDSFASLLTSEGKEELLPIHPDRDTKDEIDLKRVIDHKTLFYSQPTDGTMRVIGLLYLSESGESVAASSWMQLTGFSMKEQENGWYIDRILLEQVMYDLPNSALELLT